MASNHDEERLVYTPPSEEEQLSPTDGYFSSRRHPRQLYISTRPSHEGSSKDTKPKRPSSPNSTFSSSPAVSDTHWSADSLSVRSDENSSLLSPHSPPPDYNSTEARPYFYQPRPGDERRENNRRSGDRQLHFFPSYGTPQRMTDIEIESQNQTEYVNPYTRPNRPAAGARRRTFIMLAKTLVVLTALGALAWMATKKTDSPTYPPPPYPFNPKWPASCSAESHVLQNYSVRHLEEFEFCDNSTLNSYGPKLLSGDILILPGSTDQAADLEIRAISSGSGIDLEEEFPGLVLGNRLHVDPSDLFKRWRRPSFSRCAQIVLHFRPGLVLSKFRIVSTNMDVKIHDSLIVTGAAEIVLTSGNVFSRRFISSRETRIDVGSGSVSGSYDLYDLLSVKTNSGSISINVNPKPVDDEHPAPAVLLVHSKSGSVNVQYPVATAEIPDRDYRTTIISQDGSVGGKLLHGRHTTIETQSASINVQVLPYAADQFPSTMNTRSASGSTKLELLSPYKDAGRAIARLSSTHTTNSGQLVLDYPDEWEGKISGQTRSGSLKLSGSEVRVIDQGSSGGGHYVVAEKGDGNSALKFSAQSGSADATVGF